MRGGRVAADQLVENYELIRIKTQLDYEHPDGYSFLGASGGACRRIVAVEVHSLIVFTESHAS
jgi:hypothetical protein